MICQFAGFCFYSLTILIIKFAKDKGFLKVSGIGKVKESLVFLYIRAQMGTFGYPSSDKVDDTVESNITAHEIM